jgi:hypothetical protein
VGSLAASSPWQPAKREHRVCNTLTAHLFSAVHQHRLTAQRRPLSRAHLTLVGLSTPEPKSSIERLNGSPLLLIFMDVLLVSASLQRLQIGDDILAILDIGNAEDHLGPVYISGRIGEIFVELLLVPCDASGFEGG